jgi:hypothetical protein
MNNWAKHLKDAEACAARYKRERDGMARKISHGQSLNTASFEAERKIANQREEINILLSRIECLKKENADLTRALQGQPIA